MAKFRYIGTDKDGKSVNDVVEAASEAKARIQLGSAGIKVARIAELSDIEMAKKPKKALFGTGVTSENVTIFSRQLATLLKAGLPLLRSLEVIGRQEKNPFFKSVIEQLADNVRTGNKVSDGLSQHPKIFDHLYVNMARAGEAGGVLDVVLDRVATFQEKSLKIKSKVKGAMVYPIVIMIVAVIIVSILMVFVIPKFQ
ncbi:MAG: type II secretion system F family protein, partial [Opitutales bacterium]|nr:type II secretion system F family protein [Opitutales bacterium]